MRFPRPGRRGAHRSPSASSPAAPAIASPSTAATSATSATRARQTRLGAAVTVPIIAATLAIVYPGTPVSQVDLHDGSVWLTNTSALKLGRYNPQIEELNAGLVAEQPEFDVLQDEGDVLLTEPGKVAVVDPASVTLAGQTTVPLAAQVSMAGGVTAVVEPQTGDVWTRTVPMLGTLSVDGDEPDLELGAGGGAVVARDGTVLAAEADGTLLEAVVTAEEVDVSVVGTLAGEPSGGHDQVTAVGDVLVALDGTRVHTSSGSTDLGRFGEGLLLQQPGPADDVVLVATRTALLEVPLGGGAVREHATGGDGAPAAPVRVGACAQGAWASVTGSHIQLCGSGGPVVTDLRGMTSEDRLVFRVNRDTVVLNDTLRGRLWLPLEDPELREPNWQDIQPDEETENDSEQSESTQSTQNIQAECSAQSTSPTATDDDFGVRAGRTLILSVIDNDSSSDCGILAISEFDPLPPEFGTLTSIYGGRALQLVAAPDAVGTAEFTYTITDGRGSSAPSTATVRLTVRDPSENLPPEQTRVGSVVVEQGATTTYDVLPDFRDPDGDHLVLAGGVAQAGGTVRTRQDGELTFTSDGASLGRQTVSVLVSDGVETVEGTVLVDVRPAGSVPPVIDPVHAQTYVDQGVVVRPLDAVRSVSREPVRLAGVDEVPGATIVTDLPAGTFTFTAASAGTYYVTFLVTASPQQVSAVARIDVRERPEQTPPPTAVMDVALLPPGGEVTIDPLANDEDPGGGVLVLQSVEVPDGTGLRVAVLKRQLLQITSERVLEAPVIARYTISNGTASATGDVLIQPIPASATQQPPVVPNVKASVRTDGVVTIPVLEGAYDPDGDPLTLVPTLAEAPAAGDGLMFVSGDVLRFRAPSTPMEVHATFNVRDPAGNVTAATVTVTVHAADPETKAPPRPRDLTARVFEGATVRIDIPLVGIDPDGDGVTLLGPDKAPAKGRIVSRGADWFEYEALPGELGTDTFTYAVEDWVGQRAVATIRVGIAARPTTSAQVISRNDDVTVRPGQTVEVRVLANDRDTGGGELTLEPDLVLDEGVEARVEGRRVVVETPDSPGVLHVGYTATNARGGLDTALLTVTVVEDAPFRPPVAADIVVPAEETINRTSVEVDVLSLAQNPSGPLSDLEVSVLDQDADVATVTPTQTIVVTLVDAPQTLPYRLTNTHPDADGLRSYAFITVPALGDFPPVRRPRAPELAVIAGETLEISLAEQVQVAPGRAARVLDGGTVTATKSDGSPLWINPTTLSYTPQRTYAGPASISFEVSDGGGSGSRSTVMTLPITVLAAEDYPPTFAPSVLDVGPDESTRVDLTAFTSAPVGTAEGGARYTYRLTSAPPAGFTATLDGSVLTVSAAPTARKGTVGGVGIEIGYGTDRTVAAQVDFRVTASTRQLARVLDHQVPDGVEGQASSVSVLAGAYNPFPGQPMTVVSAVVETPGAGTANTSGDRVTVRPADGFIGQMVTRYRVRDVTGDPDREVEARITVTVRGRPSTPTTPRVGEVRDRTVVLAWDAPANNGAPITGYTLTAQPGGTTTSCASTTCTVTGLTNDVEYTFTVTAQNAVGTSDPSASSAPARPDTRPGKPAPPQMTRADQQVTATWTAPENTGSPIQRYVVELSDGRTAEVTGTSHTFTGLTNGQAYQARVRAINRAPDPGDPSEWSATVTPARISDPPASVTVTNGYLGSRTLTVAWSAPASDGGEPITEYRITLSNGEVRSAGPGERQVTFTDVRWGQLYTAGVQARNVLGWSSARESTGEIYGAPGPVTGLAAVDVAAPDTPVGEGRVNLSWSRPESSGVDGAPVSTYQVYVDGAFYQTVNEGSSSAGLQVVGLGGGGHSFSVVPVNNRGVEGPAASASGDATTVPEAVSIGADTGTPGQVTFSWSTNGTGGSEITGFRYRVVRQSESEDLTGSQGGRTLVVPVTRGSDQLMRITVWAVNARGESVQATFEATGAPPPPDGGGGG